MGIGKFPSGLVCVRMFSHPTLPYTPSKSHRDPPFPNTYAREHSSDSIGCLASAPETATGSRTDPGNVFRPGSGIRVATVLPIQRKSRIIPTRRDYPGECVWSMPRPLSRTRSGSRVATAPPPLKKGSKYPDEEGNKKRLCAKHARIIGTYQVRNPCRDCPPTLKKQSNYPDEEGNHNKLCATHAYAAGTVAKPCAGASRIACAAWHRLEKAQGIQLQHVHFVPGQDLPDGTEFRVPGDALPRGRL